MNRGLIGNTQENIFLYASKLLFLFFLLFKPLYILPSGSFQIGDFFLCISFLCLIIAKRARIEYYKEDLFFLFFLIVSSTINLIYYFLVIEDKILLFSILYYTYVFAAILLFQDIAKDITYLKKISSVIIISLLIQLLIYLSGLGRWYLESSRYMGTFNDPNQYATFVFFSFLIVKIIGQIVNTKYNPLEDILCLYLMLKSASTGMMLGFSSFYIILIGKYFKPSRHLLTRIVILLICLMIIISSVFILMTFDGIFHYVQESYPVQRLFEKVENIFLNSGMALYNVLSDRGLDKILVYPEFLIFGSGEGGYLRYENLNSTFELHSTILGILYYYGIIPFSMLTLWVYKKVQGTVYLGSLLYLIPLTIECLTLANQRQPYFWMIFILLYFIKLDIRKIS